MTTQRLRVGDLVAVKRSWDRVIHLQVRVIGPGWFIGHCPTTHVCHYARDDDIVSILG